MEFHIGSSYEEMSARAAELIIKFVNREPDSLLCLAAGSSPLGTFAALVSAAKEGMVNFERSRFVSLDEWAGLDGREEGSCRKTLTDHFFRPIGIREEQIRFFDGTNPDLEEECKGMDRFIADHGGVGLFLLGIGLNGHVGFNEPGVDLDLRSHVTQLDSVTVAASAKYFQGETPCDRGITLGIGWIREAGKTIVVASGAPKAGIVAASFQGPATNRVPASLLQTHPNLHVCLDEPAASLLSFEKN